MQGKNVLHHIIMSVFRWLYLVISLLIITYILWTLLQIIYNTIFAGMINVEQQIFSFLSTTILIIVGLELGELVYARDYKLLVDILIFAIARKIIIKPEFNIEYTLAYFVLLAFILVRRFVFSEKN